MRKICGGHLQHVIIILFLNTTGKMCLDLCLSREKLVLLKKTKTVKTSQ